MRIEIPGREKQMKQKPGNKLLISIIFFIAVISCLIGAQAEDRLAIPPNVTTIQEAAFENVPLQNVKLEFPAGLKRIESRAFAGTGLRGVFLSSEISYIADDAFDGCDNFHPIVYPGTYAADWCADHGVTPYIIRGLGVIKRTKSEIKTYIQEHPVDLSSVTEYRKAPTGGVYGGETYSYGLIRKTDLDNGIAMINRIRYIAGLNADVVNADDKEEILAASALINALNGTISHYPARPEALSSEEYDELYNLACTGGSSSNLHMGHGNLAETVLSYMDDSDSSNIDRVGHRRWILNPSMGRTTFGFCHQDRTYTYTFDDGSSYTFSYTYYYSGMYAFDRSGSGTQKPVAWPAQVTPLSCYTGGADQAWSVSFGQSLKKEKIHITLIRKKDQKTWEFGPDSADGDFYVDNGGYGQPGCVIFRAAEMGSISAGDTFAVSIRDDEHYTVTEYTVSFIE